MSLIDQLARVREMSGMDPLPDPSQIQGFGPNDPPVPPYIPEQQQWTEPEEAYEPVEPPPSPLIPRRPAPQTTVAETAVPLLSAHGVFANVNLIVVDNKAVWKQRNVELTANEQLAVRTIVLKAIQRELSDELAEAGVRRVRRQAQSVPSDEVAAVVKKRGRPKKA